MKKITRVFIVLTLGLASIASSLAAGDDCEVKIFDLKTTKKPCKGAYSSEVLRQISYRPDGAVSVSAVYCCIPGSEGERDGKREAGSCQTTSCLPSSKPNVCATLPARYINNTKLVYEKVIQESCTMDQSSNKGVVAVCCRPNSTESLLVSVLGAENDEFPHQARLNIPGLCGATIYNRRFLITAAHCIVNREGQVRDISRMTTVLGSNIADVMAPEYVYKVKRAIPHPEYGKLATSREWKERNVFTRRWINDIGLVELDRDIKFGDHVKALEIAPKNFDPFRFAESAVIVGWGTTDTLTPVGHLQKANFLLRRDDLCAKRGLLYPDKKEQLLCVGGVLEGKWSPTAGSGDSGGPAICRAENERPVLCGVTSYGGDDTRCQENSDEDNCPPSVYAEVTYFRDWIQGIAGPQEASTLYKPFLYGRKVGKEEQQHQVRITTTNSKQKPCGGTLIQPDVILTTAHCIFDGKTGAMHKDVNVIYPSGSVFGIKAAKALPNFKIHGVPGKGELVNVARQGHQVVITDNFFQNDLAVVVLNGSTGVPAAKLPRLPNSGETFLQGVELAKTLKNDSTLMAREYTLLPEKDCQERLDRLAKVMLNVKIDRNILCGVEKYSGGSTCDRELGGGLLCRGKDGKEVLCGVQNFRLCMFSLPNGFVNLGQHESWIQTTIKQLK